MDELIEIIDETKYPPKLTICVLLYGDNLPLAERCLSSIISLPQDFPFELRIGMNEVCEATSKYVQSIWMADQRQGRRRIYISNTNRGKYPIMRWMLHDPINPILSPYVMWFDDDSYIQTPTQQWLDSVLSYMTTTDMCGEVMTTSLSGHQPLWIQLQPWYNGLIPPKMIARFIVGGWWTIKTEIIEKLDWPPTNIIHRGGDYMLGEAFRQHGLSQKTFTTGVSINSDQTGCSHTSARRGLDPLPVGIDFEPSLTARLHLATRDVDLQLLDYPGM